MQKKILPIVIFLILSLNITMGGQTQKIRVYGYVIDENNRGIENVNVHFDGMNIGGKTNHNGYYDLSAVIKDSATIIFSHLGYESIQHTILSNKVVKQITVILPTIAKELKGVEINSVRRQTSTMQALDPERIRLSPNASGNFESMLISFTGVNMNNELSSQYNVRGGSFDENIVYVNGTEIYKPLLIRAGQQEGLSFINTDMVGSVSFSAGG
ncbi:MAG: carboxypeptidase-like regulatory domain-containing protein, partial [Paludibacteraceae bacterium]